MKRLLIFTSALLMAVQLWSQASISIDALQEDVSGDSLELVLYVNNEEPLKAFQCDLTLPASISFNKVDLSLPKDIVGFDLDYKYVSDKQVRILVSSGCSDQISADLYDLILFNVSVPVLDNVKDHLFRVTDITFVYKNYRSEIVAEQSFTAFEVKEVDRYGLIYSRNSTRDAFNVFSYTDTLKSDVVIPTELYGLPVTAIAPGALAGAGHLRSIEIPSSIQTVGEGAFSECYNLLTIEWNSPAALRAACFDEPEAYGNMLVFCKTAETAEPAVLAAADELFAGNVVIDGVAENIRLTDGRPFSNPRNFTAKNITYSREFTKETRLGRSGGWEAMVLPFAVQTVTNTQTGATLVPFAVADFTYTMPIWQAIWQAETQTFVQSQAIEANQPFLMQVPNSTEYQDQFNQAGEILFSAKNTELKAVETTTEDVNHTATGVRAFSLKGAYEGMAVASDRYVINDEVFQTPDGELIPPGGAFVSDLRALRPFEAYIQLNPASNVASQTRAGYLRIGTDTSTGIESLKMTGSPASHGSHADHWYNLQGLRLPSRPTQPGLYIHNGEKVMIK